jgi:hypothetical protein
MEKHLKTASSLKQKSKQQTPFHKYNPKKALTAISLPYEEV